MANQLRTVQLPEDLCVQAESWLKGRFDSLEGLLSFLLAEIVKDDGAKLDQHEEEIVQQRLRDLGYI
ncbi:MAG TPA: hypothetical protein VE377_25300 [Candidatus Dormibacteraeota bacterium]|nr:hypothetical protein [Candidatus Dormibacteraeota bacterium]